MKTITRIGRNRTGLRGSPLQGQRIATDGGDALAAATVPRGDLDVRQDYVDEADALGSVPMPMTVTAVVQSAGAYITGRRPQVLIDRIGERLAFGRVGARLYETLLVKCRVRSRFVGLSDPEVQLLAVVHDHETEHAGLLARALRDLGADPTAQTPGADLVGVECQGLVQAINDPRTTLLQSLRVMLDAELIDRAGWELLVELAHATDHAVLAERFEIGRQQASLHVSMLDELVRRLTMREAGAAPRSSAAGLFSLRR